MKLQQLMSPVRKAIDTYEMIDHGDRIAIGISGGKDSTALLYALNGLSKYYPKSFQIEAVTVDLGFGMDFSPISQIWSLSSNRWQIIHTD